MEEKRHMARRIIMLLCVLTVAVVYVVRLAEYQLVKGEQFVQQTTSQTQTTIPANAARGEIYDANGRPLVVNHIGYSVLFLRQYMTKDTQNQTILTLTSHLRENGETWNDSLPLVWADPVPNGDRGQFPAADRVCPKNGTATLKSSKAPTICRPTPRRRTATTRW